MFSFHRGPLAFSTFCLYSHSPFFAVWYAFFYFILFGQRFMFRSAFTSLLAFIFRFSWLFCFAHPFIVLAAVCLALYCRLCIFLSIHYFYCLSDKNVRSFITLLSDISCCLSYFFVFNLHMLFYCLSDQNCFALLSSD